MTLRVLKQGILLLVWCRGRGGRLYLRRMLSPPTIFVFIRYATSFTEASNEKQMSVGVLQFMPNN